MRAKIPPPLARRSPRVRAATLALAFGLAACDFSLPWSSTVARSAEDQPGHGGLTVSPAALTFRGWRGGPAPAAQVFELVGLPADAGLIPAFEGAPLTVSIEGVTVGRGLSVRVPAPDVLGEGTWTGTLTIRARRSGGSEIQGGPWTLPVTYLVGPPALGPPPPGLVFDQVVGGPLPPTQAIAIAGAAGAGTWRASVPAGAAGWLQVSPTAGASTPATLVVSVVDHAASRYTLDTASVTLERAGQSIEIPVTRRAHDPLIASAAVPVVLAAVTDQADPPAFGVDVETEASVPVTLQVSVRYLQSADGTWPYGWLAFSWSAQAPSRVPFQVRAAGLAPGHYEAVVEIVGGGSPAAIQVPVSLDVSPPAATMPQAPLSHWIIATTAPADLVTPLALTASTGLVDWTAAADVPWLSVTPAGVASPGAPSEVRVAVVPGQLELLRCRTGDGQVIVRATPRAGGEATLTFVVPVHVDLQLPCQLLLGPDVDPGGAPGEVVILGGGLSPAPTVLFGDTPALTARSVSPWELRATPPSLPPGEHLVTIPTALGLPLGSLTYRVVGPAEAPAAVIAAPGRKSRLAYDDATGHLWSINVGAAALERLDRASGWALESVPVAGLRDAALLPGPQRLMVLAAGSLQRVDAIAWPGVATEALAGVDARYSALEVPLDGHVLLLEDPGICRNSCQAWTLDLATGLLESGRPGERAGRARSGQRVAVSATRYGALNYWDAAWIASIGSIVGPPGEWGGPWVFVEGRVAGQVALDRHGDATLVVRDGTSAPGASALLDAARQPVPGHLPPTIASALLTQRGDRAVAFDGVTRTVRVFDLASAPDLATGEFVELGAGGGFDPGGEPGPGVVMTLSADDRTLFLGGDERILVVPLP